MQSSNVELLQVIGKIYDAALQANGALEASKVASDAIGAASFGLFMFRNGKFLELHSPLPLDECIEYVREYAEPGESESPPFHHISVTLNIEPQDGTLATFSLHRPETDDAFDEDHRMQLSALAPHLERAVKLNQRLGMLRLQAEERGGVLERLSQGAMIVSPEGELIFANAAARRIAEAEDGVSVKPLGRRLLAALPSDQEQLDQLILSAGSGGSGGLMEIRRPSTKPPYTVLVSPPPAGVAQGKRAFVFLVDSEDADRFPADWLREVHGFTTSELVVARSLMSGETADQVAASRQVSINTVRAQVRTMLLKARVGSLRDLAVKLGRLPG